MTGTGLARCLGAIRQRHHENCYCIVPLTPRIGRITLRCMNGVCELWCPSVPGVWVSEGRVVSIPGEHLKFFYENDAIWCMFDADEKMKNKLNIYKIKDKKDIKIKLLLLLALTNNVHTWRGHPHHCPFPFRLLPWPLSISGHSCGLCCSNIWLVPLDSHVTCNGKNALLDVEWD